MNVCSGRRCRVMIACVTFETAKVADPVRYYECNKVHILHYTKKDAPKRNVYQEFYDETCRLIREQNGDSVTIEGHNGSVSNFSRVLTSILSIIESEQRMGLCDIFINISAGSPEYSAAAAIAAMMSENVLPFSVNSKEYSISSEEEIRSAYYSNGRPVGLTVSTYEPRAMPKYTIEKPPEHLVRALRVLNDLNEGRCRTKSTNIVPILREKGIWFREGGGSSGKQSDAVNYHRDFVSKWLANGWVEKDDLRKRLILTDEGRNVIETFYHDVPERGDVSVDSESAKF